MGYSGGASSGQEWVSLVPIDLAARATPVRLLPLFLVSMAAIGYEIALTRFFAIASWSEYGYWVISMTMVGLAASGIAASLLQRPILRHAGRLLAVIPPLLILAAALGWTWTTLVPFNPLELQNRQLWADQLGNIAQYYAALFPFFFLVGFYISLYFMVHSAAIGRVYAFDLAGAGLGAVFVLGLMFVVHPFFLIAGLLLPLAVAGVLASFFPSPLAGKVAENDISTLRVDMSGMGSARGADNEDHVGSPPALRATSPRFAWGGIGTIAALVAAEVLVCLFNPARINEYKEIYGPLNVPDSRVVATRVSPKGLYELLDNFTERLDLDMSNNSGVVPDPTLPRAYGLYADGNRLASLPRSTTVDTGYFGAALDALPYRLRRPDKVLLLGASGGFRIHEALGAGAGHVTVIEPDRTLRHALLDGLGPAPAFPPQPQVSIRDLGATAVDAIAAGGPFDVIDIGRDFVTQSDTNRAALSVEVLAGYIRMLSPQGVLSIPVSIREFTVYAVKMFGTVRHALAASGVADPAQHLVIYRSAWNVRILVARSPWPAAALQEVRDFCDARSFDPVHYPGIDPAGVRIFNELPVVSFDTVETRAGAQDAMMAEAAASLAGAPSPYHAFFRLTPPTLDRPFVNAVLPLAQLGTILARIELVPREELGTLINIAVLAQAVVIALLVMLLPLVRPSGGALPAGQFLRAMAYFAGLGLGFLFLEIYLIEKAALYLHDRVLAFGLVLATMLVFSGIGSWLAERFRSRPSYGVGLAVAVVIGWNLLLLVGLDAVLALTAAWPGWLQILIVIALAAPLSVALGMPMALGLSQFAGKRLAFLPWAWAVNGACSIVSTPLANLLAAAIGFMVLPLAGIMLYVMVVLTIPVARPTR
ncbi:hypothetical protein FHP25_09220 [Vineibacter terrae]|uniref:Spermidine synthase n=1 Tax=Vineibacter terrae TaxID=2586908 RepID=A0A5C8PRF0_9HYPH|nr:hypothetical protein [Vineibacter terrae]TXL77601.1 hypothetical protein FHP25_09220 [Vineibacter terrae]